MNIILKIVAVSCTAFSMAGCTTTMMPSSGAIYNVPVNPPQSGAIYNVPAQSSGANYYVPSQNSSGSSYHVNP